MSTSQDDDDVPDRIVNRNKGTIRTPPYGTLREQEAFYRTLAARVATRPTNTGTTKNQRED